MATVPANDFGKSHSPSAWKMSNARESWAWNGCEGRKTRVEVYARTPFVELKLNGKTIGRKRVNLEKNCLVSFKVKYFPGELTAIAYDRSGKECGRTSLFSGKGTPKLLLTPEKMSVGKDELAYIRIRYADEDGKTLPLCRGRVKVSARMDSYWLWGMHVPITPMGISERKRIPTTGKPWLSFALRHREKKSEFLFQVRSEKLKRLWKYYNHLSKFIRITNKALRNFPKGFFAIL